MSDADREKWDARYRGGAYEARRHPTALLSDWLADLPRGRALDLGCGTGRNALALAGAGWEVDAADISAVALARGRERAGADAPIDWIEADLETEAGMRRVLGRPRYDVLVMVRYVNMDLMRRMTERLTDGGYLLCEQHLKSRRSVVGPSSAAFRLEPNQLLRAAIGLRVLYYREGVVEEPDGRLAALAQLVACRGEPRFETGGTPF